MMFALTASSHYQRTWGVHPIEEYMHARVPLLRGAPGRREQGSLRGQLDLREKGLGWAARVNVALGAALGLAYLHDQAEPPVGPPPHPPWRRGQSRADDEQQPLLWKCIRLALLGRPLSVDLCGKAAACGQPEAGSGGPDRTKGLQVPEPARSRRCCHVYQWLTDCEPVPPF